MSATKPTTQTARKTHRCHYCGGDIVPGCKYARWRSFDGAYVATVKVHLPCDERWADLLDYADIHEGDGACCDEWLDDLLTTLRRLGEWIHVDRHETGPPPPFIGDCPYCTGDAVLGVIAQRCRHCDGLGWVPCRLEGEDGLRQILCPACGDPAP